jgi:taurine dioxygenase
MPSATGTVEVTPLTGSIGAAIRGVALGRLDDDTFGIIRQAFFDHCMLTFPDQHIDDADLMSFARRWGTVMTTPMLTYLDGYPGILRVYNRGKEATPTEYWHPDSAYLEKPPAISILAAQALPPAGGDTMWCNQYLAYESLSEGLKAHLSGLRAKFSGAKMARRTGHSGEVPFTYHPVVRTHPETGRKALYISHPETVPSFENMTEAESRPVLDYLYAHCPKPDRSYRHVWKSGDVVMWDNRSTMHYAVHDFGDAERVMHRVTIEGERPA